MTQPNEKTFAFRLFQRHPNLRNQVTSDPEFEGWKDQLKTVIVDQARYFVVGGDILKDEDELALDFARQSGLVSEDLLARERDVEE